MFSGYDSIASIYDNINAEIDYSRWADFIEAAFEKHLEKYNDYIVGSDDIVKSIVNQKKHIKHFDSLDYYNLKIKNSLYELFDK